jgi:hypothetical protein
MIDARFVGGYFHGKRKVIHELPYVVESFNKPSFFLDDIKFTATEPTSTNKDVYHAVNIDDEKLIDKDGNMVVISDKLKPHDSKTIRKIVEENERITIQTREA